MYLFSAEICGTAYFVRKRIACRSKCIKCQRGIEMHYVVGDVHGCMKELMLLINKIQQQDEDAVFFFLGDWIDKGPNVDEVKAWVVDNVTPDGRYRSLRGNHEQDAYFQYVDSKYRNLKIMDSFLEAVDGMMPYNLAVKVETVYGTKITYRLCHAWHDFDENKTDVQKHTINIYGREIDTNESDEIIVHGHTPTISGLYLQSKDAKEDRPGLICYRRNSINLDGGCVYFNKYPNFACMLCAICLETLEEFYPYELEDRIREGARLQATNPDCVLSKLGGENASTKQRVEAIYGINIMRYMKPESKYRLEMLENIRERKREEV